MILPLFWPRFFLFQQPAQRPLITANKSLISQESARALMGCATMPAATGLFSTYATACNNYGSSIGKEANRPCHIDIIPELSIVSPELSPELCPQNCNSFIPTLGMLIESSPSLFVALITLNLLEVSPRPIHLPFMVASVKTWLKNSPNDINFWVDYGMGRRICVLIETVLSQDSALLDNDESLRLEVDRLLSAMVSLGIADAK